MEYSITECLIKVLVPWRSMWFLKPHFWNFGKSSQLNKNFELHLIKSSFNYNIKNERYVRHSCSKIPLIIWRDPSRYLRGGELPLFPSILLPLEDVILICHGPPITNQSLNFCEGSPSGLNHEEPSKNAYKKGHGTTDTEIKVHANTVGDAEVDLVGDDAEDGPDGGDCGPGESARVGGEVFALEDAVHLAEPQRSWAQEPRGEDARAPGETIRVQELPLGEEEISGGQVGEHRRKHGREEGDLSSPEAVDQIRRGESPC